MSDSVFTPDLTAQLDGPLNPERVTVMHDGPSKGVPYLEGHDVARRANELFGYGNWSFELVGQPWPERGVDKNDKPYTVWCAMGRITVRGGLTFTDIGTNLQSGPGGPATEMSIKGAVTDAMKRALRLYGDQFGLVLYDKSIGRADLEADYREQQHHGPVYSEAPEPEGRPAPTPAPVEAPAEMSPDEAEELDRLETEWAVVKAAMDKGEIDRIHVAEFLKGENRETVKLAFASWMGKHAGRTGSVLVAQVKSHARKQPAGAAR